jgi:hypothetical protein
MFRRHSQTARRPGQGSPSESRSVPVYRHALFQRLVKAYLEDPNFHRNLAARERSAIIRTILQLDALPVEEIPAKRTVVKVDARARRELPDSDESSGPPGKPLKVDPNEEPSEMTLTFPLSLVKVGATVQQSANEYSATNIAWRRTRGQLRELRFG